MMEDFEYQDPEIEETKKIETELDKFLKSYFEELYEFLTILKESLATTYLEKKDIDRMSNAISRAMEIYELSKEFVFANIDPKNKHIWALRLAVASLTRDIAKAYLSKSKKAVLLKLLRGQIIMQGGEVEEAIEEKKGWKLW